MSFEIFRLDGGAAAIAWAKALPHLEKAIGRDALFDVESVRDLVTGPEAGTANGWSLWIAVDTAAHAVAAAWVTKIERYPRGSRLIVAFAGGEGMDEWYDDALAATDRFGRENGCGATRIFGRGGWARCGYRPIGHILERTL